MQTAPVSCQQPASDAVAAAATAADAAVAHLHQDAQPADAQVETASASAPSSSQSQSPEPQTGDMSRPIGQLFEQGSPQPAQQMPSHGSDKKFSKKAKKLAKKAAKKQQLQQNKTRNKTSTTNDNHNNNNNTLGDAKSTANKCESRPANEPQQSGKGKQRSLVNELKLFQNNQLLNQQDPIQQLQHRLDQIITPDHVHSQQSTADTGHQSQSQAQSTCPITSEAISDQKLAAVANQDGSTNLGQTHQLNQRAPVQLQQQSRLQNQDLDMLTPDDNNNAATSSSSTSNERSKHNYYYVTINNFNQQNSQQPASAFDTGDNNSTVKKGILWQQQNYDKFHQRLFSSRWKKRYFILTTDYLVCFKRSAPKVGRSEMGEFIYKTALSDMKKIAWLRPNKSDKGAIVLHLDGQFNLLLWSKTGLHEWMFLIEESVQRNRNRRLQSNSAAVNQTRSTTNRLSYKDTSARANQGVANLSRDDRGHQGCAPSHLSGDQTVYDNSLLVPSEVVSEPSNCPDGSKAISRDSNGSQHTSGIEMSDGKANTSLGSLSESSRSRQEFTMDRNGSSTRRPQRSSSIEQKEANPTEGDFNGQCEIKRIDSGRSGGRAREPLKAIMINDSGPNETAVDQAAVPSEGAVGAPAANRDSSSFPACRQQVDSGGNISSLSPSTTATTTSSSTAASSSSTSTRQQARSEPRGPNEPDGNLSSASGPGGRSERAPVRSVSCNEGPAGRHPPKPPQHLNGIIAASTRQDNNNNDGDHILVKNQQIAAAIPQQQQQLDSDIQPMSSEFQAFRPNMIRRDDSWQSLVSLNRIGRPSGPAAELVTQGPKHGSTKRSLYAQHIMPNHSAADSDSLMAAARQYGPQSRTHQHMTHIESTVTPLRNPNLMLQYNHNHHQPRPHSSSVLCSPGAAHTASSSQRKLRPLFNANGNQEQLGCRSFDQAPGEQRPLAYHHLQQQQQQQQYQQHPHRQTPPLAAGPANQQPASGGGLSYREKLLQLQLLHSNSNNVDYVRNSLAGTSNDYLIYGPESGANHYGYYSSSSMRSNLKSAASEFSFIRPSAAAAPAGANNNRLAQQIGSGQSTLPHRRRTNEPSPLANQWGPAGASPAMSGPRLPNQAQFLVNPNTGECLVAGPQATAAAAAICSDTNLIMMGNCPNPGQQPGGERELPHNRFNRLLEGEQNRPTSSTTAAGLPKSSSLTSSIASFFKRAFTRRPKKSKSRSKSLRTKAESCSSSLGAFEDSYNIPAQLAGAPSAFSTGSKSTNLSQTQQLQVMMLKQQQQQQHLLQQQPKMVEMIEAFATHTNQLPSAQTASNLSRALENCDYDLAESSALAANLTGHNLVVTPQASRKLKSSHQGPPFGGSPLHKSNSICTTMGLSLAHDAGSQQQAASAMRSTLIQYNELVSGQRFLRSPGGASPKPAVAAASSAAAAAVAAAATAGASPMLMRSAKVMSANFSTPNAHEQLLYQQYQHQELAARAALLLQSPRARHTPDGHLPRPSSIYGQPSMIASSSPVMTGRQLEERNMSYNNFGLHRASVHGQRDINHNHLPLGYHNDPRRHLALKLGPPTMLDPTKEVSEELVSPVVDSRPSNAIGYNNHNNSIQQARTSFGGRESPHVRGDAQARHLAETLRDTECQPHNKRAIVNPILQSPRAPSGGPNQSMDTIYDNHPLLSNGGNYRDHHGLQSAVSDMITAENSLYDNHNHQLNGHSQHQKAARQDSSGQHQSPAIMRTCHSNSMIQQYALDNGAQVEPAPLFYYDQRNGSKGAYHVAAVGAPNNDPMMQPFTPSRRSQMLATSDSGELVTVPMHETGKPAAIVAPVTPNHNQHPAHGHQHQQVPASPGGVSVGGRSPMMSRRHNGQQQHDTQHSSAGGFLAGPIAGASYQQSPLVSAQTRILKRAHGVQATIIGTPVSFDGSGVSSPRVTSRQNSEPMPSSMRAAIQQQQQSNAMTTLHSSDDYDTPNVSFDAMSRNHRARLSQNSNDSPARHPSSGFTPAEQRPGHQSYYRAAATGEQQPRQREDELSATPRLMETSAIVATTTPATTATPAGAQATPRSGHRRATASTQSSSGEQSARVSRGGGGPLGRSLAGPAAANTDSLTSSSGSQRSYRRTSSGNSSRHGHHTSKSSSSGGSSEPLDELASGSRGSLDKLDLERNWITSKLVDD